jgi:DNA (cytosine-5)-methyltransferase 1
VHETPERVDLICGGFPCQPVSVAGKRLAQADERWLWPEFARVIRVLRPRFALVENVPGLLTRGMGDVLSDLAALGYDAEWRCISAADVGAPHQRDRIWIVAYAAGMREQGESWRAHKERPMVGAGTGASDRTRGRHPSARSDIAGRDQVTGCASTLADTHHESKPGRAIIDGAGSGVSESPQSHEWWAVEPDVGRVAHGVPDRVDRLRGLGNAVVPQVIEEIGRWIMTAFGLTSPTFGSLFAGIGGMDLGLERAGFSCRWQVEIDPWCQRVLAKHWPDVPRYGDIRTFAMDGAA